jgi:hypothetical protein
MPASSVAKRVPSADTPSFPVFIQLIQALIEKNRAEGCTEECSILERLQNYRRSVGSAAQTELGLGG